MRYFKSLTIESFKGLQNLEITNFEDVNLFIGENNTCKTTVLEALLLFQAPNDFKEVIRTLRKRDMQNRFASISVYESFINCFHASQEKNKHLSIHSVINDIENHLEIVGNVSEKYIPEYEAYTINRSRKQQDEISEDIPVKVFNGELGFNGWFENISINEYEGYPNIMSSDKKEMYRMNMKYVSSADHLSETIALQTVSKAIENDDKSDLLKLLKLFDENIDGVEILVNKLNNRPKLYLKHKKFGFMPLSNFGDGVKKVLALASGILRIDNGVLLIDEIETAIHTSGLDEVFTWLLKACKIQNVQIFATTHSDEALRSFLSNYKIYDLKASIYRLEQFDGQIISRRFSGEKAFNIIVENGGDLR